MTPIVLKMFVSSVQENSGAPGSSAKSVSLSHQKGPNPVTPGPNDALFETPQQGNINVNLAGLTDAVHGVFAGGKGRKIKVTIEDETPEPASGP
jgi:hypothetical protein